MDFVLLDVFYEFARGFLLIMFCKTIRRISIVAGPEDLKGRTISGGTIQTAKQDGTAV